VREWRLPNTSECKYNLGEFAYRGAVCGDKACGRGGYEQGQGFSRANEAARLQGLPGLARHGAKAPCPRLDLRLCPELRYGRCLKKGKKMGGQMGNCRVTSKNHVLVAVDQENNLLVVKGTVPGRLASTVS